MLRNCIDITRRAIGLGLAGILLALPACKTTTTSTEEGGEVAEDGTTASAEPIADAAPANGGFDLSYLMTMQWSDAVAISPQSIEIPPFFRVAAETIEVVKTMPDGRPQRVRAKGKVFLEVLYREPARILCQEAYVGDDEVVIRGRSILQRGGTVLEGLDDYTVFYMLGTSLRAIGLHRFTDESEMLAQLRLNESFQPRGGGGGSEGFSQLPTNPPALPTSGPWVGGPNLILPPLSPESVPGNIRSQMRKEAEAVEMVPLGPPPAVEPPLTPPPAEEKPTPPAKSETKVDSADDAGE